MKDLAFCRKSADSERKLELKNSHLLTRTFPQTPPPVQFPQSPAGPLFGRGAIDFIKKTCGAHYRMMTASWEVNKKSI